MQRLIKRRVHRASAVALAAASAAFLQGCGGETTIIRFDSYAVASRFEPASARVAKAGEPGSIAGFFEGLYERLVPPARATVGGVRMCFKRLRFKRAETEELYGPREADAVAATDDSSPSEDNVDLEVGLVSLSPLGTELTQVEVPAGVYRRVEFDLKDECGTGYALLVMNDNGIFTERRHTKIWFEGVFYGTEPELVLNTQAIIDRLDTVTSSDQLKEAAESAGGRF